MATHVPVDKASHELLQLLATVLSGCPEWMQTTIASMIQYLEMGLLGAHGIEPCNEPPKAAPRPNRQHSSFGIGRFGEEFVADDKVDFARKRT